MLIILFNQLQKKYMQVNEIIFNPIKFFLEAFFSKEIKKKSKTDVAPILIPQIFRWNYIEKYWAHISAFSLVGLRFGKTNFWKSQRVRRWVSQFGPNGSNNGAAAQR